MSVTYNALNDVHTAAALPINRRVVEDEIERLIGLLDGIDGDENLEATGDDEPSLGWPNAGQRPRPEMSDDREVDNSDYEDGAESEPDLGWTEEIDQKRRLQTMPGWKVEDGEPDLGFIGHGTGWTGEADVCEGEGHPLHFDGDGYGVGKKLLKRIGADGFVYTAPALPIAEYVDSLPDLDGDCRALHYPTAHERHAKTGESK